MKKFVKYFDAAILFFIIKLQEVPINIKSYIFFSFIFFQFFLHPNPPDSFPIIFRSFSD